MVELVGMVGVMLYPAPVLLLLDQWEDRLGLWLDEVLLDNIRVRQVSFNQDQGNLQL